MAGNSKFPLAEWPEPRYTAPNRAFWRPRLDFRGSDDITRVIFGKPEPQYAQYYYQAPYRSRTQAHRPGWLRPSKFRRCAWGLWGPFFFSQIPTRPSRATTAHPEQAKDYVRNTS